MLQLVRRAPEKECGQSRRAIEGGGGGDARAGQHLLEQGRFPWALRRSAPPAPRCDAEAWTAYPIVYEGE